MNARGDRNYRTVEPPAIRTEDEIAELHAGEWKAWLARLTPDEVANLDRLGLTKPEPPRKARKSPRLYAEPEEVPLDTCANLKADKSKEPDEALMQKEYEAKLCPTKRRELILLGHVLPVISDAKDARLEASIVALALKVGARQGITAGILAEKHQQVRQSIEERVRRWEVKLGVCRADLELLKYVIAPILASRSPGLEAEAIAKAARIGLSNSERMEDVGAKHGVCRQAISRRVRVWCKDLGLPLPRECKRNTEAYRLYNVTKQAVDPFKP